MPNGKLSFTNRELNTQRFGWGGLLINAYCTGSLSIFAHTVLPLPAFANRNV